MRSRERKQSVVGLSPAEAAAHWRVRQDRGDLSEAEQNEFDAWLAAAPRNAAEYEKAQRSWDVFDAAGDDKHLRALRHSALKVRPEKRRRAWPQLAAGFALLVAGGALVWVLLETASPSLSRLGAPDYITARGERLNLTLPDGTAVTMNTETAIDVVYERDRRFVQLTGGQAFFDVARDRDRPFVVQAGERTITALGTAFEVRLLDGRFKVLLVEGTIAVEDAAGAAAAGSARAPEPVVMTSGQELAAEGTVARVDKANVQRELRWRDGFIEFQDETLADAVAEFNRYSPSMMVIDDERVAALRVTGVFRTDRADHFMDAMSELLPVAMDNRSSGQVYLVWAGD